jgi:sulfur carrier protein ThiS
VNDAEVNPDWANITNIPADIADGDDDTQLTDAEVAVAVNNEFPNLDTDVTDDFSGSFNDLTDVPADIADGDDDTTYTAGTGLNLSGTEFSVNDAEVNPDWANITNIPADIADGDDDTQLTDAEVAVAVNNEFPNLDTDVTDDFSGSFNDLTDVPADIADGDDVNDADSSITNEIQDLSLSGSILSLSGDATTVNLSTLSDDDVSVTNTVTGHQIATISEPGITAVNINETVTSLSQNTTTGVISYTDEDGGAPETANVVAAEANNSITVGANGGAFFESPVKAFGKINSTGGVTRATTGVTVTKLTGNGYYRVNLPSGLFTDGNYIIHLSQPSRDGAGNDDPGISYRNQTAASFEVIIGDNDNGGTDRSRFDSEFMFMLLDL